MRKYELGVICFVFLTLVVAAHAQPIPHHETDWALPETSIDAEYVAAVKTLFGKELADPRGGTFCRVKVILGAGTGLGEKGAITGLGWVKSDSKRVVLMDGIEYEVEEVIEELDVATTLRAFKTYVYSAGRAIPINELTPVTPALLLVLGHTDLAEDMSKYLDHSSITLTEQLFNFLWQRYYMQVAEALVSHEDKEGLMWSRLLLSVAQIEAKTKKPEREEQNTFWYHRIVDLEKAQILHADLLRRVKSPKQGPADLEAITKLGKEECVAAYVDALDDFAAKQISNPGSLVYGMDPLFKAISEEGEDMIPALIDVLENDDRMTRSVSFHRSFRAHRNIHSVRSTALHLIRQIWPSSAGLIDRSDYVKTARVLRTAWVSVSNRTQSERWLDVLRDDTASNKMWLEAALYITRPSDEIRIGSMIQWSTDPEAPLNGEPLRSKYEAEVSELFMKRSLQMIPNKDSSPNQQYFIGDVYRMGHCLMRWQPSAAKGHLKELCKRVENREKKLKGLSVYAGLRYEKFFGIVIADRLELGDLSAMDEWKTIASSLSPSANLDINFFRAIWTYFDVPYVQESSKEFFDRWLKDISSDNSETVFGAIRNADSHKINSPLLAVPAFRRVLVEGLKNDLCVGEVWITDKSSNVYLRYDRGNNGSGGRSFPRRAEVDIDFDKHIPLTAGGYLGDKIAYLSSAPLFVSAWPDERRNRARQELIDWLLNDSRDWTTIIGDDPRVSMGY